MKVIIIGGGKTGSSLAEFLLADGHFVRVIEWRPQIIEQFKAEMPAEVVVAGDGADPAVLISAGIAEADVVAAATGDDEDNLVIATLARFEFSVPRVIARVNNPKNAWLFTPEMGVDVSINQAFVMAKLIAEEMSLGDMMTLLKLRQGDYSVVEEKVDPAALAVNTEIGQLSLPDECVLIAIIRQGELIVPRPTTVLQPADEVLALVNSPAASQLAALLSARY